MYQKISKCRMCKKVFREDINDTIVSIGVNLELKKNENDIHFCENGDIGIIELIGYRKKK